MAININTTELKSILDSTPSSQNVMLVGRHGIGKSQILTQYFSEKGMPVISLFLGQMSDPGDLIGLPVKNEKTGKTDFMPPYWFPLDGSPVVLFLDELNRARPEVLQTIMDLALNRKLAGRPLPEGSRIISAVNDGEEYQLTELDPALVSRFNVYNFRPTAEEWLLWGVQTGLDKRVLDFIQDSPFFLDGDEKSANQLDSGLDKSPDRRAWHKVSDCIKNVSELTKLHHKQLAGIVGAQAASKFVAFAANTNILTGKDVLLHFDKCREKLLTYQIHQLSSVNDSIFRFLETQKLKAKDKTAAKNALIDYVGLLLEGDKREAMAHFSSVFESSTYPNAIMFVMTEAPDVYSKIMDFISSI